MADISRRGFLGLIGAAAAAPAVVKAENLMRCWSHGEAEILVDAPSIVRSENIMKIQVPPEKKLVVVDSMQGLSEEEIKAAHSVSFIVKGLPKHTHVTVFDRNTREIIMQSNSREGNRVEKDLLTAIDRDVRVKIVAPGRAYAEIDTRLTKGSHGKQELVGIELQNLGIFHS
jgi:hypothetical protein